MAGVRTAIIGRPRPSTRHRRAAIYTLICEEIQASKASDVSEPAWCVDEVGAAMRLPGGSARARLDTAGRLSQRLPAVLEALTHGEVDLRQATVISDHAKDLPAEVLGEFQGRVLKNADRHTVERTRRTARAAMLSLDPAAGEQRHEQAVKDRNVWVKQGEDDMAYLGAYLPAAAADAMAVYGALTDSAASAKAGWRRATRPPEANTPASIQALSLEEQDTESTIDELRADTLVDLILAGRTPTGRDDPERGKRKRGRHPAAAVVIGLDTLTGLNEEPGWLGGYGPVTAGYARELAHDPTGTWRRLVVDPLSGKPLDYGTTTYEPPQHLADHVITRDGSCAFPFCNAQARLSDLDHTIAYPDGPTADTDLKVLHRRHHNAKTHGGWRYRTDPDTDDTHWHSPLGLTYTTTPEQHWTLPTPRTPHQPQPKPARCAALCPPPPPNSHPRLPTAAAQTPPAAPSTPAQSAATETGRFEPTKPATSLSPDPPF